MRDARCTAVIGTSVRSASSTALRPATTSAPPVARRVPRTTPLAAPLPACDVLRFSASTFRLCAAWYVRSSAFGVGPLPSRDLRLWPPVPTRAPFLLPSLRTAPGRFELPAIVSLFSAVQVQSE